MAFGPFPFCNRSATRIGSGTCLSCAVGALFAVAEGDIHPWESACHLTHHGRNGIGESLRIDARSSAVDGAEMNVPAPTAKRSPVC